MSVIDADGKKLFAGKDYTLKFTTENEKDAASVPDKYTAEAGAPIYVWVSAKDGASYSGSISGSYA